METTKLEAAWAEHQARDMTVRENLALEFAKLDNTRWISLQEKARGCPAGDREAADALAGFAGHVASRRVLELIARAYQRAGQHDLAVEYSAKALVVTPRWDPIGVARMCNAIAWALHLRGDDAAAIPWAERGVAADPTYGPVVGTLCEIVAAKDPARALASFKLLETAGYPPSSWGDYTPGSAGKKAKPLVLRASSFTKHTEEDAHRYRISTRFDHNASQHAIHHGQALLLAGANRLAPAYLAASLAVAAASGEEKVQSALLKSVLASSLDPALVKQIDGAKGRFARDPEKRADAAEKVKKKGGDVLADMVLDPIYGVSMAACKALVMAGEEAAAKALVPFLDLASSLEHETGQSIYYDHYPKPFDIVAGAKSTKPTGDGADLVAQAIAAVKKGGKKRSLSIPAPEPVPPEVLEKLVLAEGVPLTPSLRAWLAFDGGWIGREYGWFEDPAAPVITPLPVHALVFDQISTDFAPCFLELPGKLADVRALPLDGGSESLRMLALVPGPDGEYPVIYIDVDDNPLVGVEAPSFAVWIAAQAGLVGDVNAQYASEIKKVGKHLLGGKEPYAYLDYSEKPEAFAARVAEEKRALGAAAKRLAAAWGVTADKPAKKERAKVPTLSESKLAEALGEAIDGGREARVAAFLEDAKARFPDGRVWKSAAIAAAVRRQQMTLVRELLALGADVDTNVYLENRLVHSAAQRDDAELLRLLLDAGADIEARGYSKQTPLHDACDKRCVDAVRLLVERKASLDARNENNRTPLIEASNVFAEDMRAEFPKTVAVATILLDAGADINASSGQTTALHQAIGQRNLALVRLLVERGADLEAPDYAGASALMAAHETHDLAIIDLLGAHGARTSTKNKAGVSLDDIVQADGRTPAVFDVSLRCTEEPQAVKIHARWLPSGHHSHARWCTARMQALTHLAAAGLAGSDVFAPTSGVGSDRLTTVEPTGKAANAEPRWTPVELVCDAKLGGVSPAAVAMFIRGLYGTLGYDLTLLEIKGERGLDGSPLSIDTARARGWLADPRAEPYKAWPEPPALLGEHPARDVLGRVRARVAKPVNAFLDAFEAFLGLVVPAGVADMRDRIGLRGVPMLRRRKDDDGWERIEQWRVTGMPDAKLDVAVPRAAFANGVTKLAIADALEAAEWSLGVTGAPPREGYDDSMAKQDRLEPSPSSRATCPKCKDNIEKGELRFAEATLVGQRYYHLECAAERLPSRLQQALARYDDDVPDREEVVAAIERSLGRRDKATKKTSSKKPSTEPQPAGAPTAPAVGGVASAATGAYPYAETAKTGRSSCITCGQPIAKDNLRIAVPRTVETPQGSMTRPGYLHPGCAKGHEGVSASAVIANTAGLVVAEELLLKIALGE